MEPADQLNQTKSIYEASAGEVFFKNFMAGFGRALGSIFIYLVFILLSTYAFVTYAYPQIKPFIDEYRQAVQSMNNLKNTSTTIPGTGPAIQQYQQLLNDLPK